MADVFSSHPYPARRDIVARMYYCEPCDKDMKTTDKVAHLRGKKHAEKMAENTKPGDIVADWSTTTGGASSGKACHNCGGDHLARDCTAPRKDTRECHGCGEVGHAKADCPNKPRQLCHNCGGEGHRKSECTQERQFICRNCNQPGHVARDCPEEPNPANFKCNNCENMGHKARDCPEPKDWNKVRCNNCQQMGHTSKRCRAEPAADSFGGNPDASESWIPNGVQTSAPGIWDDTVVVQETIPTWDDSGAATGQVEGASGGWDSVAPSVSASASGGWESTDASGGAPAW